MGERLTDRDERLWQRRVEERVADPLPIGYWIRKIGSNLALRRPLQKTG